MHTAYKVARPRCLCVYAAICIKQVYSVNCQCALVDHGGDTAQRKGDRQSFKLILNPSRRLFALKISTPYHFDKSKKHPATYVFFSCTGMFFSYRKIGGRGGGCLKLAI